MSDAPHIPVMLSEVLAAMAPREGEVILDGTFGAGGYSRALLAEASCRVIGLDRDPTAIAAAEVAMALEPGISGRLSLVQARFSALAEAVDDLGFEALDGVVLDLGVSSMQLDQAERGFSFRFDGPLDMRMGKQPESAASVVNGLDEEDLARVIYVFGEERRSRAVARAIVRARAEAPITSTAVLADLVAGVVGRPKGPERIHPATRTFQALRIFVNDELFELAEALQASEAVLRAGGRLVVVTFHSLEDRIVKRFFAARSGKVARGSRHAPAVAEGPAPSFEALGKQPVAASEAEAKVNPRARSAKLRAGQRTDAPAHPFDLAELGLARLPRLSDYRLPSDLQLHGGAA